jgi:hypothetical protein
MVGFILRYRALMQGRVVLRLGGSYLGAADWVIVHTVFLVALSEEERHDRRRGTLGLEAGAYTRPLFSST